MKPTVTITLSSAARKTYAVETGVYLDNRIEVEVPLRDMTPEQRAQIIDIVGRNLSDTIWVENKWARFEAKKYPLTVEDFLQLAADYAAVRAELERSAAAETAAKIAERTAELQKRLELPSLQFVLEYMIDHNESYGPQLRYRPSLDGLVEPETAEAYLKRWDELVEEAEAQVEAIKQKREEEEARRLEAKKAEEARKEAARFTKIQARIEWARANGSDRLREGLEQGYDCKALFEDEFCAFYFPSATYDHHMEAEEQDRTCPSLEALQKIRSLKAEHPSCEFKIVWLKKPPRPRTMDEENYYHESMRWEGSEAIRVDHPDLSCYAYIL